MADASILPNEGSAPPSVRGLTPARGDRQGGDLMTETVNTGLDDDTVGTDGGVGDITLNPRELGHFKSP